MKWILVSGDEQAGGVVELLQDFEGTLVQRALILAIY